MKANKIKPEYIIELLENIDLKEKCEVCVETMKELLAEAKKQTKYGVEK